MASTDSTPPTTTTSTTPGSTDVPSPKRVKVSPPPPPSPSPPPPPPSGSDGGGNGDDGAPQLAVFSSMTPGLVFPEATFKVPVYVVAETSFTDDYKCRGSDWSDTTVVGVYQSYSVACRKERELEKAYVKEYMDACGDDDYLKLVEKKGALKDKQKELQKKLDEYRKEFNDLVPKRIGTAMKKWSKLLDGESGEQEEKKDAEHVKLVEELKTKIYALEEEEEDLDGEIQDVKDDIAEVEPEYKELTRGEFVSRTHRVSIDEIWLTLDLAELAKKLFEKFK